MQFNPYVFDNQNSKIDVSIESMTELDAESTNFSPIWQTSWTSEYLSNEQFEKYSAKVDGELIALGAYEILERSLVVHIVYIEAHPESNPTFDNGIHKYTGIGKMMIAFGIKLSIDSGFGGEVILEAKTSHLAKHYERDFGAVRLPIFNSAAPRYLISGDAAKRIFLSYLV